jgi:ACT domain-containing protein
MNLIEDTQLNRDKYKDNELTLLPDITAFLKIFDVLVDKNINILTIKQEISKEEVIEALVKLFSENQRIKKVFLKLKYSKDS